jgi:hypothetical protein
MGGMNIFFVFNRRGKLVLATPKISGSILKGVTRHALLTLAGDLGYVAEECHIRFRCEVSGGDLQAAARSGTVNPQAARPNNPAMKRACPAASPLVSHLTLPFRIMCTVSIPCSVRHAP